MRRSLLVLLPIVASVSAACGDPAGSGDRGTVTVFAAASLTSAFEALGTAFTVANSDIEVTFNFAASSELVAQIVEGAPADVFASADTSNMDKLVNASQSAGDPVVFATNALEIITAPGNPEGISSVSDLAEPDLIVITCAPDVPCGRYAQQVFTNAGITVEPKSLEENVKAVVAKVTAGEADAGVVYATDVIAAGSAAVGVAIPADINVVAEYPIAVTEMATDPAAAQAFIDFVLSADGQAVLRKFGFGAP